MPCEQGHYGVNDGKMRGAGWVVKKNTKKDDYFVPTLAHSQIGSL
jgi:hypothetical protein